jgi:hypothetical protein
MKYFVLFAQRNEEINQWLDQNPLVLGLMFIAIGVVVGGWGIYELATGVSHSKRGKVVTGNQGKILSLIRIVAGVGCILFGLYKMVF